MRIFIQASQKSLLLILVFFMLIILVSLLSRQRIRHINDRIKQEQQTIR